MLDALEDVLDTPGGVLDTPGGVLRVTDEQFPKTLLYQRLLNLKRFVPVSVPRPQSTCSWFE